MIPTFPVFKKIDFDDKDDVELYTHKYRPYSDFNFISLWAWDTDNKREISCLNGNLVVLFTDYQTNKPFLSFLGNKRPKKTILQLIDFANTRGLPTKLSFITEESLRDLKQTDLDVTEDRNNFDYIFSIQELADLRGNKYSNKRHLANRFYREYPQATFEIKRLNDESVQKQLMETIYEWERNKKLGNIDYDFRHEEVAINRLLQASKSSDSKLLLSCIIIDNKIIGFSIDELLPKNYSISHFAKADITYKGIYEFLNQKISQYMKDIRVKSWNWEQDLGINSHKIGKSSYRPSGFLKKFIVSSKSKTAFLK